MAIVTSHLDSVPGTATAGGWQRQVRRAVRDGRELCRRLGLPEAIASSGAAREFPVFVPESFLARMRPGDPDDPLLRQVLPLADEQREVAGFDADPVGDRAARVAPGLLQKYAGRALLVTNGTCAVHCRYCFRRHYPYQDDDGLDRAGPDSRLEAALRVIEGDSSLEEVLLSGGDPLMMVDDRIGSLVRRLGEIPHVQRIRFHSRLPVMIPERVTHPLLKAMQHPRLSVWMVIHANHPAEIDRSVGNACRRLAASGIPVLNQAVLLRAVNDSVEALAELSRRLTRFGVIPYYLHQLDRVHGAAHFEVPVSRGKKLVAELRRQLPGYAVPRYVRETEGDPFKRVLA